MLNKTRKIFTLVVIPALVAGIWVGKRHGAFSADEAPVETKAVVMPVKPKYVRGIHLTAWVAGSPKSRETIAKLLDETELNSLVIDVKEYEGEVYIPGIDAAEKYRTFVPAIPGIKDYIASLKQRNIYTIARIVVFKDNLMARKQPALAVKDAGGGLWEDRRQIAWLDPYNKAAWEYNLAVARRAAELGFDEIQFDYIRFPSDGNTRNCRYSQVHNSSAAAVALNGFLEEACRQLAPMGVKLSIDVFGLTTTVQHDMGIGQKMVDMSRWIDFVSPMVYPSHYANGEYGIENPDSQPYRTVFMSMSGARKRMGEAASKLRPWLQDFSLGHRYGAREVQAQIQALYDNDIGEWLLWNPRCVYTKGALKPESFADTYEKTKRAEPESEQAPALTNATTSQQ